jgi:hypothetical protein
VRIARKPVFWIAPSADLHPPGMLPCNFDPNRLVLVHPAKDIDTLAAMEVALREGVAAAVVGGWDSSTAPPRVGCLPASVTVRPASRCAAPHGLGRRPGGQRCRHPLASHRCSVKGGGNQACRAGTWR